MLFRSLMPCGFIRMALRSCTNSRRAHLDGKFSASLCQKTLKYISYSCAFLASAVKKFARQSAHFGYWYSFYSNHQNWRHTAGRGAFSAAEAPKTQEALMAFKFLGQRQLGKLPSRWVSTILMVAIKTSIAGKCPKNVTTDHPFPREKSFSSPLAAV